MTHQVITHLLLLHFPAMLGLGDWVYWLLCLGVISVIAALVYVAWRSLFADRSKGKRRCPRCWYDLSYSNTMTCSECGFTAQAEKQFAKTRRRYGLAFAAILANVAIALYVTENATQRGWASLMPTRALLWVLPLAGGQTSEPFYELSLRARGDRLSQSQWRSLITRCAAGDWRARPTTDRWVTKYGNFVNAWRRQLSEDKEVESILFDIPPRLNVTTRDTWPEGVPVVLSVHLDDWWPWGMECRIRAIPQVDGAQPITFYRTGDDRLQHAGYSLYLPPINPSTKEIQVDFEIERRRMASLVAPESSENDQEIVPEDEWEAVNNQTVSVKTTVEGSVEDLIEPVSNVAMFEAMQDVFGNGVVKWAGGPSPVRVYVDLRRSYFNDFNNVAIGVSAELVHDEVLARRLNLWWIGGAGLDFEDRNYSFEVDYENLDLLTIANGDDGLWQMRIVSNPELALRAGDEKKFWKGEFIVPLTVRNVNDTAPSRPWWTDEEVPGE